MFLQPLLCKTIEEEFIIPDIKPEFSTLLQSLTDTTDNTRVVLSMISVPSGAEMNTKMGGGPVSVDVNIKNVNKNSNATNETIVILADTPGAAYSNDYNLVIEETKKLGFALVVSGPIFVSENLVPIFNNPPNNYMTWKGKKSGAEHIIQGKVKIQGITFDSDPSYPLTFMLTREGYKYICGRGKVTTNDGKVHNLGYEHKVVYLRQRINQKDLFIRRGAAQGLGYLTVTSQEKTKVTPLLINILKTDEDIKIRRDAAEALGRIGDEKAIDSLQTMLNNEKDPVIPVIKESLALIKIKNAIIKYADDTESLIPLIIEGTMNDSSLVQNLSIDRLKLIADKPVDSLIAKLQDKDEKVRLKVINILANIEKEWALNPLREALIVEKNENIQKSIKEAIKKIQGRN